MVLPPPLHLLSDLNYVARPGDKINTANLFPIVSIYDYEAIDYAYGERKTPPSLKSTYFTTKKGDPFSQPIYLSNDLLKSAQLGIDNLKDIYPELEKIVRQQPFPENKWSNLGMLTAKLMIVYSEYLKQAAFTFVSRPKLTGLLVVVLLD